MRAVKTALVCRNLGWEAATERMLDAGSIEAHEWPGNLSTTQERMLWSMYNTVMGAPFVLPPFPVPPTQC